MPEAPQGPAPIDPEIVFVAARAFSEPRQGHVELLSGTCSSARVWTPSEPQPRELLAVGAWAVYKLCEDGQLPHVRITNSIRIRPADLQAFIASKVAIPETPRPHRRKKPNQ